MEDMRIRLEYVESWWLENCNKLGYTVDDHHVKIALKHFYLDRVEPLLVMQEETNLKVVAISNKIEQFKERTQ